MRHNNLRDECFFRCLSATWQAERELSGLLPSDPHRRPADVFVHTCPGLGPLALEFAVTCPLRDDMCYDASRHALAAAMDEAAKLSDRDTGQRCAAQGFKLAPMVAETFGGWGPEAQHVFKQLAKANAESSGVEESVATNQLYEALGIKLQRANARAILSHQAALAAARCNNTTLTATSRSEAALVLSAAVTSAS